jgi:histidine triad (HIT) family protein
VPAQDGQARCVFCDIVGGAKAQRVLDDGVVCAFLDIKPLFKGHVLVVPKTHVVTLTDLPEESVGPLFSRVRAVTAAVTKAMKSEGSFVAMNNVVSQSVPHLHAHVVPRTKGDGLKGFFWPRHKYESEAEMADVAQKIRDALTP